MKLLVVLNALTVNAQKLPPKEPGCYNIKPFEDDYPHSTIGINTYVEPLLEYLKIENRADGLKCKCHETCEMCGYSKWPVFSYNCISCKDPEKNMLVKVSGPNYETGSCVPRRAPGIKQKLGEPCNPNAAESEDHGCEDLPEPTRCGDAKKKDRFNGMDDQLIDIGMPDECILTKQCYTEKVAQTGQLKDTSVTWECFSHKVVPFLFSTIALANFLL